MHAKRLTLIGIAAIAAGYTFLSNAGPAIDVPRPAAQAAGAPAAPAQAGPPAATPECGLGPAPDAPGFAGYEARQAEEVARNGYRRVCQGDLARFDIGANLKPLPLALAALDFRPVDLADTPMATFTSLGGMAEAVGQPGSQTRSRLYRSFRMPDGRMLTLFEHDLSADGSRSLRDPQDEPERINGLPARLDVLQADGGKAVSILGWQEGRRDYELWIDANVVTGNMREQFLALAATLPKSVPAQADEPAMASEDASRDAPK